MSHSNDFTNITEPSMMTGSAVAVEWVFLGGWDIISLQCASLQADTIQTLMLVKKHLHLACEKANAALRQ